MARLLFENLEIQGFRRFNLLTIEKLGHVNLIMGKNNVGKSTLLEGLLLYANLGSPQVMLDILQGRDELVDHRREGSRPGGDKGPAVWSLFHGHPCIERISSSIQIGGIKSPDSTLTISIEWFQKGAPGQGQEGLVSVAGPAAGERGMEVIPALVVKIGGLRRVMRLDEDFTTHCRRWLLQPRSVLDLTTRCVFVGPNGLPPLELERLWDSIVLTEFENDVKEALQIIAPEVSAFALLTGDSGQQTARVKSDTQAYPIPLKALGDGMNRLFGLAMALVNSSKGIVLIDELENGLHYSVLPAVWKFILKVARRLDVQVFATSHSYDCLKAFQAVTKADKAIEGIATRLEQKGDEIRAALFDEARLDTVVSENIEIR